MKIEEAIALQPDELQKDMLEMFRKFPPNSPVMLRTIREGVTIMEEGEPCVTVYLLLRGAASSFWNHPGHCQYMATHSAPLTFLGDLAVLCDFPNHTTSMRTSKRSVFLTMRREVFDIWLKLDPDMYRMLAAKNLRMLSAQAKDSRNGAMQINEVRILEYLYWYYEANRNDADDMVIVKKVREQIAEDIGGISLRTLNRHLAQMEQRGLFSIVKGKIQITQKQCGKIVQIIKMRKI